MILFYEITKSEFFHKPWMVIKRYGRNVNNSAVYSKFETHYYFKTKEQTEEFIVMEKLCQ